MPRNKSIRIGKKIKGLKIKNHEKNKNNLKHAYGSSDCIT